MSRAAVWLLTIVIVAQPVASRAEDGASPHRGTEMCPVCHNEDMSLSRSKLETCTLCHATTVHSGAAEHLRVEPARVARAVADKEASAVKLPLRDDGGIWCGTCHLFHDPSMGEAWLPEGWIPPNVGFAEAVRNGVLARAEQKATTFGEDKVPIKFATKGTRALRLPVADGSLCHHCHGSLP